MALLYLTQVTFLLLTLLSPLAIVDHISVENRDHGSEDIVHVSKRSKKPQGVEETPTEEHVLKKYRRRATCRRNTHNSFKSKVNICIMAAPADDTCIVSNGQDASLLSSVGMASIKNVDPKPDETREPNTNELGLKMEPFSLSESGENFPDHSSRDDVEQYVHISVEPADIEQGCFLPGNMQEDTQLGHRPLHYLNSTITVSETPQPSLFSDENRGPGAQSSNILRLPLELQQFVYSNLDVASLLALSSVSKFSRFNVAAFPAWRTLSEHSPEMLIAMSQMKLLRRHTVSQLYEALCSARCVGCPPLTYGAYVFLPTADRCCWVCLSYHPMFRVISLRKASKTFGVSVRRIRRDIHVFQSIPGIYDEGFQVSLSPHLLVCAKETAELGLRVHGSLFQLKAMAGFSLCDESVNYQQEAAYLQSAVGSTLGKIDPWSWAPPTKAFPSPRPLEECATFDTNFGKAALLVPLFIPGVGIERALWCKGCNLAFDEWENHRLSDDEILAYTEDENKRLGNIRGTGHLDVRDILRGLSRQPRSPDEIHEHSRYCWGAQKIMSEASFPD